jgi:hypothetical protein
MKFALLHVDQAIELILKECVRANGKSVYKNPKETITIWGAYDILNALHIVIPERPDLELLHEERLAFNINTRTQAPRTQHFTLTRL